MPRLGTTSFEAMNDFTQFVFTPAGLGDPTLAIAASRAGAVGVYNAELEADARRTVASLERLAAHAQGPFGVKLTLDKCKDDNAAKQLGIEWCIAQSKELKAAGVPVLHYYTMSRSSETSMIAKAIF